MSIFLSCGLSSILYFSEMDAKSGMSRFSEVIFFGLANSPATFQAIMNEILRNLINTGKVTSFIDDMIGGTEKKEEHDEIVEEVVKRLEENNLNVKQKKCKWKVNKASTKYGTDHCDYAAQCQPTRQM